MDLGRYPCIQQKTTEPRNALMCVDSCMSIRTGLQRRILECRLVSVYVCRLKKVIMQMIGRPEEGIRLWEGTGQNMSERGREIARRRL